MKIRRISFKCVKYISSFSLVILYFYLFNPAQLFCQDNYSKPTFYDEKLPLISVDNIKADKHYLLKCSPHENCDLSMLDGVCIFRRLLNNSFIVSFSKEKLNLAKQVQKIFAIHEVNSNWKSANVEDINLESVLEGNFLVKVSDKQKFSVFIRSTPMINAIMLQDGFFQLKVTSIPATVLLNKAYITYIEKMEKLTSSSKNVLDLNLHPNRINTIQAYFPDLNGSGEVVSLKEPFYDINDIDIAGRFKNTDRQSDFSDNHSLEMITIISGSGNSFLTGLGVAPKSFHTSSSNENANPDPLAYFTNYGIQTQNHSYGTVVESFYGGGAALYDQQVFDGNHILHVFSAGNSGLLAADQGRYAGLEGYANITGNFKLSKNVLTVGAVDTSMNTILLNSNGPAFDGRIKPEIVAYSMAGTSNAAAYVSGASVLLQQAYRERYNVDMASSLVKAFLINSADEIGALGPDHKTGYGSLNAYEAVLQLESEQFIQDSISENEIKRYEISVPENAVNLRVTLVWTDPPANPNDEVSLVNDLDLRVEEKTTGSYYPWVLSDEPSAQSLSQPATKGIDHLNNIEQVYIERIESSSLEILISSTNQINQFQDFSIVYDWETENDFSWTSPTFKDNIPYNGETTSHLRWESSYAATQTGNLFYKLLSEDNWRLISENILLKEENLRWDPEIVNDFAQLKMEVNDLTYLSDTFSLSEPIRLNVGFNCTDSLSFYWQAIEGVDYYTLYNLSGNEMESFISIQDTSITIHKSDLNSSFLKVQAFKDQKPLISGSSIDYNLQASNCFLQSYFVEAVQSEGIYHNIQLSSRIGIDNIQIQKLNTIENQWEKLVELNANSFDIEFLEEEPFNGFNRSRVVINFLNGERVVSEIQSTYFLNNSDFVVYPNPLQLPEDLKVFSKAANGNARITFSNIHGQVIKSYTVPSDRNFLDLKSFTEGLYIYRISDGNNQYLQGKILVIK